jgi:hypothetical protein
MRSPTSRWSTSEPTDRCRRVGGCGCGQHRVRIVCRPRAHAAQSGRQPRACSRPRHRGCLCWLARGCDRLRSGARDQRPGGAELSPDVPSTRPLLDKLGVRPGAKVAIVDVDDAGFLSLLRQRTSDVVTGRPQPAGDLVDLVFLGAKNHTDLTRLKDVKTWIEPNGAIWVIRPKGGRSEIRDTDVIDAGLAAGLVDNKIASFSDTHGAMRLVFRLRDRPAVQRKPGPTTARKRGVK